MGFFSSQWLAGFEQLFVCTHFSTTVYYFDNFRNIFNIELIIYSDKLCELDNLLK